MDIVFALLAIAFLTALQPATPAPAVAAEQREARAVTAAGDWKTDGKLRRAAQRWDLDLVRDGDVVTGTIDVADSPLVGRGSVHGRVQGRRIEGRIADASGTHVARFNGLITATGMSGTYRDRTGETGTWSWTGRFPR